MVRPVVTSYRGRFLYALLDEDGFQELRLFRESSLLGRIVLGRVEKRIKNIGSGFVRLSPDSCGFLDGGDVKAERCFRYRSSRRAEATRSTA